MSENEFALDHETAKSLGSAKTLLTRMLEAAAAGFALGRSHTTGEPVPSDAKDFLDFMADASVSPIKFRAMRKAFGLSQTDIASLCGVTHTAIYEWESGDGPMPPQAIRALKMLITNNKPKPEDVAEIITGAELRELRKKLGLRQKDLASELGISINTLTQWEWRSSKPLASATIERIRPQLEALRARAAKAEAAA
jgi:DNA-binding transcriptional regulator YiaG